MPLIDRLYFVPYKLSTTLGESTDKNNLTLTRLNYTQKRTKTKEGHSGPLPSKTSAYSYYGARDVEFRQKKLLLKIISNLDHMTNLSVLALQ